MAGVGAGNLTFSDVVQGYGDDNVNTRMIPLLYGRYPIYKNVVWKRATHMDKNVNTVQASEVTPTIGQINKGIPATKGATKQVIDEMGFLNARFQVDKNIEDYGAEAYREAYMTQARLHAQGMFKDLSRHIFYGVAKPTDETVGFIDGFATRMNSLSGEIGSQVIPGGGSGNDNTSVYIITWSDDDCYLFYPKSGQGGLQTKTKKDVQAFDANGDPYDTDQTILKMHAGLSMPNYKNSARICNIDVSDLSGGSAADLVELIINGIEALQDRPQPFGIGERGNPQDMVGRVNGAKTLVYMNRTVHSFLRNQANAITTHLGLGQAFGTEYNDINGIPILVDDTILNTETLVS